MERCSLLWAVPFLRQGILTCIRLETLSISKEVVSTDVLNHFSLLLVVDVM